MSDAEKMAVVEDVIDVLQLRRVQHQVVGCVERRGIRCAGTHLALKHGSQGLGWLPPGSCEHPASSPMCG